MKIFSYQQPTPPTISRPGFVIKISRFASAAEAKWDDIDPEEADYIMVPFTFKVKVPDLEGPHWYNGADILLPSIFRDTTGSFAYHIGLREAIVGAFLSAFPLYERLSERHVFIDNADVDIPCPVLCRSILLKVNVNHRDPAVQPMPQPTSDPGPPRPIAEAELDVTFVGHVDQHPIRQQLERWSHREKDLRVDFRSTAQSFFMARVEQRAEMARENFDLMLRSKFVLSPRGRGPGSRRFFEILAHGRIPVLISDSAKLPLESLIDYDSFVVRVPEGFVGQTGDFIREFCCTHDLTRASELARQTYVEYFTPERFRHYVETALAQHRR